MRGGVEMSDQLSLFDFNEMEEEPKKEELYYTPEKLSAIAQYCYHLHFETYDDKGVLQKRDLTIALLPDNQVYEAHFIHSYKTERDANQVFQLAYEALQKNYREHSENDKYFNVRFDTEMVMDRTLFKVIDGVENYYNYERLSKVLYSESWYSGLNGYFFQLNLPYDNQLDREGKILYQLDEMKDDLRLIRRDYREGFTTSASHYECIENVLERLHYLQSELEYDARYLMDGLPSIEELRERVQTFNEQRQSNFNYSRGSLSVDEQEVTNHEVDEEFDYDEYDEYDDYEMELDY